MNLSCIAQKTHEIECKQNKQHHLLVTNKFAWLLTLRTQVMPSVLLVRIWGFTFCNVSNWISINMTFRPKTLKWNEGMLLSLAEMYLRGREIKVQRKSNWVAVYFNEIITFKTHKKNVNKSISPAKSKARITELNETKQKQDPHSNLVNKYQLFHFGSRFEAVQWKPAGITWSLR